MSSELENLTKIKQSATAFGKSKKRVENLKVQIQERAMKFWPRRAFDLIKDIQNQKFL